MLDHALDRAVAAADDSDAIILRDALGLLSVHTADETEASSVREALGPDVDDDPFFAAPPVVLHDNDDPTWALLRELRPAVGPPVVERLVEGSSWVSPGGRPAPPPPVVVAFYSFKGGVGRTTAAAMTALKLARRGRRVALVDFDIEAPGLHTLLEDPPPAGLVDFLVERAIAPDTPFDPERFTGQVADAEATRQGGALHVLPAGRMNDRYLAKMGRVDLVASGEADGDPLGGLVQSVAQALDVSLILLDARTGITDVGGVLLTRASHVDVIVSGTGRQHADGLRFVLRSLRREFERRGLSPDEIGHRMLFVVSRVPWNRGLREDAEVRDAIRDDLYSALSDEIYRPLWPDDVSPAAPDAEDTPFEPVLHDPVLIPHLSDLPLATTLDEVDYAQSNVAAPPFDALVERLVDTRIAPLDGSSDAVRTDQASAPVLVARQALAGLQTDGSAERDFQSEDDLRARFLPLPQFKFLFDPGAFLILGRKGSGKSALFQVLRHPAYLRDLAAHLDVAASERAATEDADWIVGYDRRQFPSLSPDVLRAFADRAGDDPVAFTRLWKALAAHVLRDRIPGPLDLPDPDQAPTFLDAVLDHDTADKVNRALRAVAGLPKRVYLVYDDLDRALPSGDSGVRSRLLTPLIEWWQQETDRVSDTSLHSKIFLRSDIYELDIEIEDKSKIRDGVRRRSIEWREPLQLYRLLLKWAPRDLRDVLAAHVSARLYSTDTSLGALPTKDDGLIRDAVEWLVGEHMGANRTKGYSYTWIPKHLADGRGQVLPRLLVALFASAASLALERDPDGAQPPTPSKDIRQALRGQVSSIAVDDLKAEYGRDLETPAEEFIPTAFKREVNTFPQKRDDVVNIIRRITPDATRSQASRIVDRLLEIGVFEERRGGKALQIPDIYLYGLGLTRRG